MKIKILFLILVFQCNSFAQDILQAPTFSKRKISIPVGLFTTPNRDIYGLSIGIGSNASPDNSKRFVRSNGIRLEPISDALLCFTLIAGPKLFDYPDKPGDFVAFEGQHAVEIINGINISCGTNTFADVNGVTISVIIQNVKSSNGLSIAGLGSGSFRNNGVQIAGAGTSAVFSRGILASVINTTVYDGKGLMAGGFNNYTKFSGVQIGIWNDIEMESEKFTGVQIGIFNYTKKLKGVQIGLWNKNEKRSLPIINWNFRQ